MADTSRTSGKRSSAGGAGKRASAGRSASSKRSSAGRGGSRTRSTASSKNGAQAARSSGAKSTASSKSRSSSPATRGAGGAKRAAPGRTKAAGRLATAASKAKTPLIAGGAALVGTAGGLLLRGRVRAKSSRNPIKRLKGVSLPRPNGRLDLGKVDLDTVKTTAERVSSLGQQAADIAAAAERTRKKHK